MAAFPKAVLWLRNRGERQLSALSVECLVFAEQDRSSEDDASRIGAYVPRTIGQLDWTGTSRRVARSRSTAGTRRVTVFRSRGSWGSTSGHVVNKIDFPYPPL